MINFSWDQVNHIDVKPLIRELTRYLTGDQPQYKSVSMLRILFRIWLNFTTLQRISLVNQNYPGSIYPQVIAYCMAMHPNKNIFFKTQILMDEDPKLYSTIETNIQMGGLNQLNTDLIDRKTTLGFSKRADDMMFIEQLT